MPLDGVIATEVTEARLYGEIERIDEEARFVWGYASTENRALDGLIITVEALADALDDYMAFANIREMHQPSAVGTAEEAFVDEGGLYIGAYVVDDSAWDKVKKKVYKAFSIGAKILARDPNDQSIVIKIKIIEISLVDRPSDPGAVFDLWRAAGAEQEDSMAASEPEDFVTRRKWTAAQRKKAAESGAAMKDGSFPIENKEDLEDAIKAFGRAKNKPAVKKHIKERAKALGAEDLIPDDWKGANRAADTGDDEDTIERGAESEEEVQEAAQEAQGAAEAAETVEAASEAAVVAAAEPDVAAEAARAAEAAMQRAAAAVEALERAAAGDVEADAGPTALEIVFAPVAELRRGIPTVNRLGWMLTDLACLIQDAQWEADIEGDGSPVPAKLRDALKALAVAYKAMSQEELAELLNGVGVDVALEDGVIALCASGADLQRFQTAMRADPKAPQTDEIARLGGLVETLQADKETLSRTVLDLSGQITKISDQIERLAKEPLPPRAAGGNLAAVSKEQDATGAGDPVARSDKPSLSDDDIARYLDTLTEEDRALLLIRAAHTRPIPIKHR